MMIDNDTVLSDKQAVTDTALSDFCYEVSDTQAVNLGPSNIGFTVLAQEDFVGATSIDIQVVGSASEDMSSPEVLFSSTPILLAKLVKGPLFTGSLPMHKPFKYIAFNYVVDGTATAGKLFAALTYGNVSYTAYNSAYHVTIN